jgi:WD40 repeat protein
MVYPADPVLSSARRCYAGDGQGTIMAWDTATGERLFTSKHEGAVLSLAVTPDGATLLSGSADRTIRCWDARTGAESSRLAPVTTECWGLAVSSDGSLAVSNNDGAVWNLAMGKSL